MTVYRGGHTTYGQAIGVLLPDRGRPSIPGAIDYPGTFAFPVLRKVVHGFTPQRVHPDATPAVVDYAIASAHEVEERGVRAIISACSTLALFQRRIARELRVPFLSSALVAVPFVSRMVGGRPIGILGANRVTLTERCYEEFGWSGRSIPVVTAALDDAPIFVPAHVPPGESADWENTRREVVQAARTLVEDCSDVAAVVLESPSLPAYAVDVQQAIGRPVVSMVTLTTMLYRALERTAFTGHL